MKKLFFGLAILAIAMAFTACPAAQTVTNITQGGEFDGVADTSPIIKYWVVHEYYSDVMRTTKIIIDAGVGNKFKSSEVAWDAADHGYVANSTYTEADNDNPALKALFYDEDDPYNSWENVEGGVATPIQTHWDNWKVENHRKAPETPYPYLKLKSAQFYIADPTKLVVDSQQNPSNAWRPIIEAYVTKTIDKIETLGYRTLDDRVFEPTNFYGRMVTGQQLSLPHDEEGRYLVLEMLSNRGPIPTILRTPGAESGFNMGSNSPSFMPYIEKYEITQLGTIKRYNPDGDAQTIDVNNGFTYQRQDQFYNANEWAAGNISILFNLMKADRLTLTNPERGTDVDSWIDYRFYAPEVTGWKTTPLYVWLHGTDGTASTDVDVPDSWQNVGQAICTSNTGAFLNPLSQEQYKCFVLAPQRSGAGSGHNTYELKELIDYIIATNPGIDPTRIYVSGHSMGAGGTWSLATAYPFFLAAIQPAAGGGGTDAASVARQASTPSWTFGIMQDMTASGMLGSFYALQDYDKVTWNGTGYTNVKANYRLSWFDPSPGSGMGYTGVGPSGTWPVWGNGYRHSSFEQAASDLVRVDDKFNVKQLSSASADPVWPTDYYGVAPQDEAYAGTSAPDDGITNIAWMFKQRRTDWSDASSTAQQAMSVYVSSPYITDRREFNKETSAVLTNHTWTLAAPLETGASLVVYDAAGNDITTNFTVAVTTTSIKLTTADSSDIVGTYYLAARTGNPFAGYQYSTRVPVSVTNPVTPLTVTGSTAITVSPTDTEVFVALEAGDYSDYSAAIGGWQSWISAEIDDTNNRLRVWINNGGAFNPSVNGINASINVNVTKAGYLPKSITLTLTEED
ncbi:MAG: hypothetical protein LBM77_02855 [Spirochaetaceae bacterium]|jgi:hypothetical protein|nr:hypothetical protein [Spirochaetaceae bacterium]